MAREWCSEWWSPTSLALQREPEVMRYRTSDDTADDLLTRESDDERLNAYGITVDDEVIGWLGVAENLDDTYRSVGIDLFITTARQGSVSGSPW